jgi:hypothetical protein
MRSVKSNSSDLHTPLSPPETPTGVAPGASLIPVLPDHIAACLFDLDGVLSQTASVHAAAWKGMFDVFLQKRSRLTGEPFRPFEVGSDYIAYVDGNFGGTACVRFWRRAESR